MRKQFKNVITMILVFSICFNTKIISIFAEEAETAETETQIDPSITVSSDAVQTAQDEQLSEVDTSDFIYQTDYYKVTGSLLGYWDGGYNATIEIENTSDSTLENWYVQFTSETEITDTWNAEIVSVEDCTYLIKNVGWNADIPSGGSIQFGISSNDDFAGFPSSYKIVGGRKITSEEDYEVSYVVDHLWGNGFSGTITLKNITNVSIQDWMMECDYENEITNIWNGEIVFHEGNHYVIHSAGYNRDILADSSVSIGFLVNDGDPDNTITNICVSSFSIQTDDNEEDDLLPSDSYVKEVNEEDIIYSEDMGVYYVKNQIVLCAYIGTEKSVIELLASEIDAEIVGYIESAEIYQLEFTEDKTYDELNHTIGYLEGLSFLSCVSYNYAAYPETQYASNDPLCADGGNWGLEALQVPQAWDYKDEFSGPVKVGVYDNVFDKKHPDLKFKKVFSNSILCEDNHGTHVAGIIGATFDNHIGVSGVATDVELYAYSVDNAASVFTTEMDKYTTLIRNGVRVINVSYGYEYATVYAATKGNKKAVRMVTSQAEIMTAGMKNLILNGYDFLIIQAAGNGNDKQYVEDSSATYGYAVYNKKEHVDKTIYDGGTDAFYTYSFAAITDEIVKNRIIVVGAADYTQTNGDTAYSVSDFSNRGSRVDVYAPGRDILSTAHTACSETGYTSMSGTSMAAPHITGLAALIWQANPSLTALQVKNIILNNNGYFVTDGSATYYMPNAEECVKIALGAPGGTRLYEGNLPQGSIKGKVTDSKGNPIENAKVMLIRTSSGEANLENYYFIATTDSNGNYEIVLSQGTYEMNIADSQYKYLPYRISGIEIIPDETKYMENAIMISSFSTGLTKSASIQGAIYDAITGNAIAGAVIHARSGWNNTNGPYALSYDGYYRETSSDEKGEFEFKLANGNYTVEIVRDGYIVGFYNMVSCIDEAGARQAIILTPILSDNEYRMILTWGSSPRDLDSHLTYYQGVEQKFHVYFSAKQGELNGVTVATLDLDKEFGYGPETVTITVDETMIANGVFRYSVYNFSGGNTLANSGAMVRVYKGNHLIETFSVPTDKDGNVWRVFNFDKNGIRKSDYFYNASSNTIL